MCSKSVSESYLFWAFLRDFYEWFAELRTILKNYEPESGEFTYMLLSWQFSILKDWSQVSPTQEFTGFVPMVLAEWGLDAASTSFPSLCLAITTAWEDHHSNTNGKSLGIESWKVKHSWNSGKPNCVHSRVTNLQARRVLNFWQGRCTCMSWLKRWKSSAGRAATQWTCLLSSTTGVAYFKSFTNDRALLWAILAIDRLSCRST